MVHNMSWVRNLSFLEGISVLYEDLESRADTMFFTLSSHLLLLYHILILCLAARMLEAGNKKGNIKRFKNPDVSVVFCSAAETPCLKQQQGALVLSIMTV